MNENDIEPGLYDMPDEQYFAAPGVSNSALSRFERSPAHYIEYRMNPPAPTPAMLRGQALHALILDPDEFDNRFVVAPEDAPKRPTKAQIGAKNPSEAAVQSIEYWNEWDKANAGKEMLTATQGASYKETAMRIRNHPELHNLIAGGLAEKAVFARDPETGLLVKCKLDYLNTIGERYVVVDLKSTNDARPQSFQKSAYNYGYFRQAASYIKILEWAGVVPRIDAWFIAAFEPDPPNGVKLYEIAGDALERGYRNYRALLNRFAECKESNTWPGYDADIVPLHYPSWAKDD